MLNRHGLTAAAIRLVRWAVLTIPLGLVVGSACSLFLALLDSATSSRFDQPWLLYLLPVAGGLSGAMYHRFGQSVESGNQLIIDRIHQPESGGVPARMAPLVLVGTLLTHLCGGSAGREGTAVQMGGGIAGFFGWLIPGLPREELKTLLMCGVSAGFGGVFGTPVAGALFAVEMLTAGRLHYSALTPCLISAIVSDRTCLAWGTVHTSYAISSPVAMAETMSVVGFDQPEIRLLSCVVLGGVLYGLASLMFSEMTRQVRTALRKRVSSPVLRPVVGGVLLIVLVHVLGTRDYLGLGVTSPNPDSVTISTCFQTGGAAPWSWLWKILFTVITVGSGFKGGEVTPLFFIGAALGNTLALLLGMPVDLFAALGLVSVFAGTTNTPLACTIMGIELFGSDYAACFALSCLLAWQFNGHSGIDGSQCLPESRVDATMKPDEETIRSAWQPQRPESSDSP